MIRRAREYEGQAENSILQISGAWHGRSAIFRHTSPKYEKSRRNIFARLIFTGRGRLGSGYDELLATAKLRIINNAEILI